MANRFYVEGEQRGEKVNDLFARIAPRYDVINDLQSFGMHRAWKRRLVHMAQVKSDECALDVCCGTGDIAFALASAGAQVTALDFSAAMLHVAKARATAGAQHRPEFQRGDAQGLPFADGLFDVVTVGYGLRNLSSWETGLREMHRVSKPGGRLLVLDFGKPDNAVWRSLYFTYLRSLVPLFGRIFCGDASTHAYILESLKHYPAQRGVAEAMRQLGCREVRIVNLFGGAMSINFGIKA
ncbi:MAG TPA: bifunctional demethylmenaquinone methyltransferase/2-methoxy-6-polyprenyl-1,4-benzoquinol methylase UbiE [Candidatus Limnocylindria bacterium]|nr:bifunctional demethylmenaquinone methyltransferase/2-methoxy-6-polyprenyl-1,4-benzoquinol methylase UbiE [Candidatus Limnocylindria bacterium]